MQICGDSLEWGKKKRSYSGGGSSSSSNGDDGNGAIIIAIVCSFFFGFFRALRIQERRNNRHVRNNYQTTATSDLELSAVAEPVGIIPGAPVVATTTSYNGDIPLVHAQSIPHAEQTNNKRSCRKSVPLDLLAADNLALRIQNEAVKGRLDSLVNEIEDYRGGSWDLRHFYIDLASNTLPSEGMDWDTLIESQKNKPQLQAALCSVRGAYLTLLAWEARGTGWASTVTEEGGRLMKDFLLRAEASLKQAAALDPRDPTPFAFLQTVAKGLRGRAMAEEWLVEARARDLFHYPSLISHQDVLMKKWYGRTERESIEWVRDLVEKAPVNHPVRVLLIEALAKQAWDAAWSQSSREALMKEEWAKLSTVQIFQNVYRDNPEPPIKSIVEKKRFRAVKMWIGTLVRKGALSREILLEMQEVEQRAQSHEIV